MEELMQHSSDTNPRSKVLFIAGPGRSGSTILEKVLGEVDGFVSLGEVRYIWERGFHLDHSCGCGNKFSECTFWKRVSLHAQANGFEWDIDRLKRLTSSVVRFRNFPFLSSNFVSSKFQNQILTLARNFQKVYTSTSSTTGADVLIDSSGHLHGQILAEMDDVELYVLHLVRDGRATCHSWSRSKVYEGQGDNRIMMPKINWFAAGMQWVLGNLSAELLRRSGSNYLRIRYEDFARKPKKIVDEILTFLHYNNVSNPVNNDSTIFLNKQHSVSGNPARYLTGKTKIVVDEDWRNNMPILNRKGVTLLTFPLLLRYGYALKS